MSSKIIWNENPNVYGLLTGPFGLAVEKHPSLAVNLIDLKASDMNPARMEWGTSQFRERVEQIEQHVRMLPSYHTSYVVLHNVGKPGKPSYIIDDGRHRLETAIKLRHTHVGAYEILNPSAVDMQLVRDKLNSLEGQGNLPDADMVKAVEFKINNPELSAKMVADKYGVKASALSDKVRLHALRSEMVPGARFATRDYDRLSDSSVMVIGTLRAKISDENVKKILARAVELNDPGETNLKAAIQAIMTGISGTRKREEEITRVVDEVLANLTTRQGRRTTTPGSTGSPMPRVRPVFQRIRSEVMRTRTSIDRLVPVGKTLIDVVKNPEERKMIETEVAALLDTLSRCE